MNYNATLPCLGAGQITQKIAGTFKHQVPLSTPYQRSFANHTAASTNEIIKLLSCEMNIETCVSSPPLA